MNKMVFHLALLVVTFSLVNCNPDDEPINSGPVLLGEGRDYIIFPEGSWWKYENTKTGEIDSIVMTSSSEELITYGCGESDNSLVKENFNMRANSETICRSLTFRIRQAWGCQPANKLNHYFEFLVKDGCARSSESALFYYPFDLSKSGVSGQDLFFRAFHDSLEVLGVWYDEVAEFELDKDFIWDRKITKYFWAKGVGLIRREQYRRDPDEWSKPIELLTAWQITDYHISP